MEGLLGRLRGGVLSLIDWDGHGSSNLRVWTLVPAMVTVKSANSCSPLLLIGTPPSSSWFTVLMPPFLAGSGSDTLVTGTVDSLPENLHQRGKLLPSGRHVGISVQSLVVLSRSFTCNITFRLLPFLSGGSRSLIVFQ